MELFSFEYAGKKIALVGSSATGAAQVFVDGHSASSARAVVAADFHEFEMDGRGTMRLGYQFDAVHARINYALYQGEQLLLQESASIQVAAQPDVRAPSGGAGTGRGHAVSFLGIFFKLLKSAKVVKVALVGASMAAWSILFSWQFALVLIGVLVFHEYGHLRAMKKCGIKTKGIYLIPFVGGVAVGEKADSHWHEVYISMMGPVFGLLMSVAFYGVFLATGSHFAGLVASVSALLNLFNLLPVYPLDGGHVVKSLVLSGKRSWGVTLLIAFSAVCFAVALALGVYFLSFFIVIGAIDLLASQRQLAAHAHTPLDRNGIVYCTLWYFSVVAIFIAIIALMASTGVPGTEIATAILRS